MSWQHSVASGWRQESRGFLKPALLPEEFGLLTRGSGLSATARGADSEGLLARICPPSPERSCQSSGASAPPERSCQSPGASAPPSALAEALRLPRLPRTCGRSNRLRMRSRLRCSWARACAFPARTASRRVSWTLFPPWLQVDLSRGAGAPASERKKPLDSATALLRPCLAIRAVAVRFGPIRLLWRTFPQTHKHALWPSALRSRLPGAAWRRVKRLLPWGCRGATALQPRLASGLVEQCFHGYRREGCGCPIRAVAKGLSFMAKEEVGAGGALGAASCEDAMNLSAGFVGWCLVGRAMLEVSEKLLV